MKPLRQARDWLGELGWQVLMALTVITLVYAISMRRELLMATLIYWYARVGWVMYALLPMTIFLLYVIGHLIVCSKEERRSQRVETSLLVVSSISPLLGMLGTVCGMSESASHLTLDQQAGKLLNAAGGLIQGLGVVLNSTAWGLMLAIPALLLHICLFPQRWKGLLNDIRELLVGITQQMKELLQQQKELLEQQKQLLRTNQQILQSLVLMQEQLDRLQGQAGAGSAGSAGRASVSGTAASCAQTERIAGERPDFAASEMERIPLPSGEIEDVLALPDIP